MHLTLTDDNFVKFAMKHYDNPQCNTVQEFEDDLKRFLYLKKLFTRYGNHGELRERLILNHIIVIYNIFGDAATNMLFFKIDEECWTYLATFLVYLNRMPEQIPGHATKSSDITLDEEIIESLRKI